MKMCPALASCLLQHRYVLILKDKHLARLEVGQHRCQYDLLFYPQVASFVKGLIWRALSLSGASYACSLFLIHRSHYFHPSCNFSPFIVTTAERTLLDLMPSEWRNYVIPFLSVL